MRPSFYPNGRNGHKQRSSLWGTGPVDPGGRSQVHGWAEPQRLRGGCDGNATSGRTGPGRCWSVQTGPGPRGHPILEDRVLGPCWVWRGLRAWGMGSLPPWRRGHASQAITWITLELHPRPHLGIAGILQPPRWVHDPPPPTAAWPPSRSPFLPWPMRLHTVLEWPLGSICSFEHSQIYSLCPLCY